MRSRFSALILLILLSACKKDTKPAVIEVTVQSSAQATVNHASINLLSDQYALVTNAMSSSDGKIDFTVTPNKTYYLFHVEGDGLTMTDGDASYIVIGTFTSQDQINSSPYQGASTKVGDSIYMDMNGDGKINDQDKVKKVVAPASGTLNVTLLLGASSSPL